MLRTVHCERAFVAFIPHRGGGGAPRISSSAEDLLDRESPLTIAVVGLVETLAPFRREPARCGPCRFCPHSVSARRGEKPGIGCRRFQDNCLRDRGGEDATPPTQIGHRSHASYETTSQVHTRDPWLALYLPQHRHVLLCHGRWSKTARRLRADGLHPRNGSSPTPRFISLGLRRSRIRLRHLVARCSLLRTTRRVRLRPYFAASDR